MSLKPWREIAIPHEDVHRGTFQQAEFAADITQVHEGRAGAEYQDPALFFRRTFITEGMGLLLTSVAQRLSGKGGDPVIQLQTAFGGGKTHTMLAVMHMAGGKAAATEMDGVPAILDRAGVMQLPAAKVVVLDGIRLSPSQPRMVDGHSLRTLWGELAWQLGGAEGYARVADADASGTSPGKQVLVELLQAHAPTVILIDELVAYIRQFEDGKALSGGTYDSNLTFVQALTEAIKSVPTAVLLASLPESEREAGSARGVQALKALEHYFGRVQAIWKPVATLEAFEIVRRRLFTQISDRSAADAVCRAFASDYVTHAAELPGETQEGQYLERMQAAYPIHPEVFERLYNDWSTLPSFQRTRGVLKLMARVIHRLWQDNNQDLMLMPGNLPLYDAAVRTELTAYLQAGWEPVLERDVDGERSEPVFIEQNEPRFGAVQACRRVTRSIFLGSAPTGSNELARGLETSRVVLGCLQPGQAPHVFVDALGRLEGRLTYLSKGNGRWWLDVRPNLRQEMEERKKRFDDAAVIDEIRQAINRVMGNSQPFSAVHVFTRHADIPDDWELRLVVLPPSAAWTRAGTNPARDMAQQILRSRGEQPRQKQNRLLFLAADFDQVGRLKDTVRMLLSWRSIEADIKDLRLTLDNHQQRQATQGREQAAETLLRLVREAYRWVLAPMQLEKRNGGLEDQGWEHFALNPASQGLGREIERVVTENELVIGEWAPVHLNRLLSKWYWKDGAVDVPAMQVWQHMCQYLYLPRLIKSTVMQTTIAAGAVSRDFFGLAYGRDGDKWRGFSFGKTTTPLMDELLLIEPAAAAQYEESIRPVTPPAAPVPTPGDGNEPPSEPSPNAPQPPVATPAPVARLTRFFATAELDPVRASLDFSKLAEELIGLFSASPGSQVTIKVDIEAQNPDGFSDSVVRAARENGKVLGVRSVDFE
ncbi:DUF499 domain-containing protein [Denitratimonas sp. CY0512]|uniref:ATP-binding protein n=1 Tax=Denitratimonas sp. CY0512 TaxID=3131940 RepID=UPI0030B60D12